MLHFVCIAIFLNQILDNKQAVIPLTMKDSQIRRKKKNSTFILETPLVFIIKLGENLKPY